MKPILALVGRPNVGKSTLFNRLTKTRDAIVADIPGLTRDRHYGHGKVGDKPFLVIDTGGFEPVIKDGIMSEMARQTIQAIDEADVVAFLVDARTGITNQDKQIADHLRQTGREVFVLVNKAEGMRRAVVAAEFFELGLGDPFPISATHGDGIREFVDDAFASFRPKDIFDTELSEEEENKIPHIAIVGRPNVGKSTLINTLVGEERVIAFDQPGTTRDSIHIDFVHDNKPYILIDTAGLRRKTRVNETVEKFSAVKTLQSIEDSNVVVLVLDARQEIGDQDASIASFIMESGRALVIAVNKWDNLSIDQRSQIKKEFERKLNFLGFADLHYISALNNIGIKPLFDSINQAYTSAFSKMPTPKLTRILHDAVARQQPPRVGLIRPKLRYAHQGGNNPPVIVIHGNALNHVPESYKRYLEKVFREIFALRGTPLRIQFKHNINPYAPQKEVKTESKNETRDAKRAYKKDKKTREVKREQHSTTSKTRKK